MPFWNTTSTTLENDQMYVNNTYKNANGDNALTTITTSNPGGYTSVNPNSSDPIVKDLAFAVQKDGKITYIRSGSNTVYNSIQEIANGGLSGYSSATTLLIKDEMQKNLTASLQEYNTANPTTPIGPAVAPTAANPAPAAGLTPAQQAALNVEPISIEFQGKSRDEYGNYYYPLSIKDNKQDVIRFSIKKPGKVTFDPRFGNKTITRTYSQTFGSVTLPIQPSISDSNTVDWSGLQLNALEAYAAGASINLASPKNPMELFDKGGFMLKDIVSKLTTDEKYQPALNVAIAQEAVGIQGLLSRATGAILNPNLELLFNGPQLRAFSFTFKMSPRSEKEATQVRNIIRFFKQGMSVKKTSSEVFLKSPHVFDVEYKTYDANGVEKKHPSINRIKTCALIGCDVDYTPDGTYMTFNDAARTMTSYQMSLRFSELEPVYDSDYSSEEFKIGLDEIGF